MISESVRNVRETLNVDAVVMEEKLYIVALYTAGLGGSTVESDEISGVGINQILCHQQMTPNQYELRAI